MTNKTTIGIIGVGVQGSTIARALARCEAFKILVADAFKPYAEIRECTYPHSNIEIVSGAAELVVRRCCIIFVAVPDTVLSTVIAETIAVLKANANLMNVLLCHTSFMALSQVSANVESSYRSKICSVRFCDETSAVVDLHLMQASDTASIRNLLHTSNVTEMHVLSLEDILLSSPFPMDASHLLVENVREGGIHRLMYLLACAESVRTLDLTLERSLDDKPGWSEALSLFRWRFTGPSSMKRKQQENQLIVMCPVVSLDLGSVALSSWHVDAIRHALSSGFLPELEEVHVRIGLDRQLSSSSGTRALDKLRQTLKKRIPTVDVVLSGGWGA